jgi:hypothetical protein
METREFNEGFVMAAEWALEFLKNEDIASLGERRALREYLEEILRDLNSSK